MTTDEESGQFRITQVQILNWGAYHGRKIMHVSRSGTAILGPSGRGKSTLLDAMASVILPNPQKFNQAARDDASSRSERTVYSYARGLTDRRKDGGKARTGTISYLRPQGSPGFASGAAITWTHDDGRQVTALRLAWVSPDAAGPEQIASTTIYGLLHRHFDLSALNTLSGNRAGSSPLSLGNLAPFANDSRDVFDQSQKRIHARMRTSLGLGRTEDSQKNAHDLLHLAQASKGIFNIDTLFKNHMLTTPQAPRRWEHALASYREASKLYDEFEQARRRKETLEPLPKFAEQYNHARTSYSAKLAIVAAPDDGSPSRLQVWHRSKTLDWAETQARTARDELTQLTASLHAARDAEAAAKDELDAAQAALLAAGGDPTGELKARLQAAREDLERTDRQRAVVAAKLAAFNLALPDDSDSALRLTHDGGALLTELEGHRDALAAAAKDAVLAAGQHATAYRTAEKELAGLSETSNVPGEDDKLRNDIAARTEIPTHRLKFAGELIEIRPKYRDWEKAVLAVIGGLAQDLIVDRSDLPAVRRDVNRNDLRRRISLAEAIPDLPILPPQPGTIPELLEIADSPYAGWLSAQLNDRFSYRYVEDDTQLETPRPVGMTGAVTRAGLRTAAHGRYVKDDSYRRYKWIGWDTRQLRHEIEQELAQRKIDLASARTREADAQTAYEQARTRAHTLRSLLEDTNWEDLDRRKAERRTSALAAELQAADTPENAARAARVQDALAAAIQAGTRVNKIAEDRQAKEAAWGLLETAKDLCARLLEAGAPLTAHERHELSPLPFAAPTWAPSASDAAIEKALESSLAQSAAALRAQLEQHQRDADYAERSLLYVIRTFRSLDDQAARMIDESINAVPALMSIRQRLINDDLPSAKNRWLSMAKKEMNKDLRNLLTEIEEDRRTIRRGLDPINAVLAGIPFRNGSVLAIEAVELPTPELTHLRETITAHTNNTVGVLAALSDDAKTEADFLTMRTELKRLEDSSRTSEAWRNRVFDARHHFEFRAAETQPDGETLIHDGVAGMSGGEGQQLIAFILGAALRYRLGEGEERVPTYASIILDEGFVKSDSDFTGRSLRALSALGFQVLIGAPREKAPAFEDHIESVAYISTDPANPRGVHIYEMTIQEALDRGAEDDDEPEAA
ncbi:ATP-binding protein [Gryllotalpicola koreensis]|uniref:ATP-binding protein n=1 Tax=Gryllotalpicola koreensis TaxID=993086 RepID=A0ABP7ZQI1_9MICO